MNVNHEGPSAPPPPPLGGAAAPPPFERVKIRPPCPHCARRSAAAESARLLAARRIPRGGLANARPAPIRSGGTRRNRRRLRHTRKLVGNR